MIQSPVVTLYFLSSMAEFGLGPLLTNSQVCFLTTVKGMSSFCVGNILEGIKVAFRKAWRCSSAAKKKKTGRNVEAPKIQSDLPVLEPSYTEEHFHTFQ